MRVSTARVGTGGRPGLPKIQSVDDLDSLDLEVVAALQANPDVTCREISERTGKSITTVWERIRRIRKSDWVEEMRRELRGLTPKIITAVDEGLEYGEHRDRSALGVRLMAGLGVLVDKSEVNQRNIPATVDDIANAIGNLGTAELERLNAKLADAGVVGASSSALVDGNQPPPDASGSGA